MSDLITCSFCGHQFDPAQHGACQSCPLHGGCQLVCCPVCGFETVDPDRSSLARLATVWLEAGMMKSNVAKFFGWRRRGKWFSFGHQTRSRNRGARRAFQRMHHARGMEITLAEVAPGEQVRLTGFFGGLAPERLAQLQAYGLAPGRILQVLQHRPVIVIRVEHTELALERDLACQVRVMPV